MNDLQLIEKIKKVYSEKGYTFFDGNKPYNLNIIGVRDLNNTNDTFNDFLYLIYRNIKLEWVVKKFAATTETGQYYMLNPIPGTGGVVVMLEGQYKGLYKIGLHKGYKAFEQVGNARYIRDNNKDLKLDFPVQGKPIIGNFKTNIHRAKQGGRTIKIGRYSAGCQVVEEDTNFDTMLHLGDAAAIRYGNSFTYTLINIKDLA